MGHRAGRDPAFEPPGLALGLAAINVKDAFWLGSALGTVVVLAALVNTVELLCTAGLPALYTRILTLRDLSLWAYHGYLLLYIAFYMLDDALMLALAIVTLGHRRLQRGEARWLKLVSGVVMVGLGVLLLVQPGWLLG